MQYIYFVLGFAARLAVIAIPLFIFNKYRPIFSTAFETWPKTAVFWLSVSIATLIICDYIKDIAKAQKAKKKYNPLLRASRESSATILKLLESGQYNVKAANTLIAAALVNIENIVEIALNKNKNDGSEISANGMTYRTQRAGEPHLTLTHWGTKLAGREPLTLKVDANLPGASAAFSSGAITYIKDTTTKDLEQYFKGKSYKSIVSIPLRKGSKTIGIVNIDSTDKAFYAKPKKFEKEVIPLISGQIEVIKHLLQQATKDKTDPFVIKESVSLLESTGEAA